MPSSSIWHTLEGRKTSLRDLRAAVDANRDAIAEPFVPPSNWKKHGKYQQRALVRLGAEAAMAKDHWEHAGGVGLRPGQLAMVKGEVLKPRREGGQGDGAMEIYLLPRGPQLDGWVYPASLVHGFDGWLPLQAAVALHHDDAAMLLTEASPEAVNTDGRTPLHHAAAAAGGRGAELVKRMLAMSPGWATCRDAGGLYPLQLLPPEASEEAAALLFEALGALAGEVVVGPDGRTPLHLAAGMACSVELLQHMLDVSPAWAACRDANGQYPVQLLPASASDAAVSLLGRAGGISTGREPLWLLLAAAATTEPSVEAIRAIVESDPSSATRQLVAFADWEAADGDLVKLKAGLNGDDQLRAGELAVISSFRDFDGEVHLTRLRDGGEVILSSCQTGCRTDVVTTYSNDFAHGFDGLLPSQAALALGLSDKGIVSALLGLSDTGIVSAP